MTTSMAWPLSRQTQPVGQRPALSEIVVAGLSGGVGTSSLITALNENQPGSAARYLDVASPQAVIVVARPTREGISAAFTLAAADPVTVAVVVLAASPERLSRPLRLTVRALSGVAPVVVLPWVNRFAERGPNRAYRSVVARIQQLAIETQPKGNV